MTRFVKSQLGKTVPSGIYLPIPLCVLEVSRRNLNHNSTSLELAANDFVQKPGLPYQTTASHSTNANPTPVPDDVNTEFVT
ncbi:MAG: hypothetical protein R3C20_14985 [Planctomycetaceae bacterium]